MKRLFKAFFYTLVLAFLSVFIVSLLWTQPYFLTIVLIIISLVMLAIWREREDVYLYVLAAIFGGLAEALAIFFGAWAYPLPDFIGIPVWLPFLWGIASVFTKKTALEIHDFVKKR